MTVAATSLAVGSWFYQPRWLINSLRRALPSVLFHVPTQEPVFALTFDDGPSPEHTIHVLDLLAEAERPLLIAGSSRRHPSRGAIRKDVLRHC